MRSTRMSKIGRAVSLVFLLGALGQVVSAATKPNCVVRAHASEKEIRHLTQVSFDEYLVQLNWVNKCTSSMTIIDKKSQRVIQTISLEGDTDNHVFDTKRYRDPGGLRYLEMKDSDNDGHKDLWFLTSWGSRITRHNVYRYNPRNNSFKFFYESVNGSPPNQN